MTTRTSSRRRWRHSRRRPNIIPKDEFEAKLEAIRANRGWDRSPIQILKDIEKMFDARSPVPHQEAAPQA